MSGEPNALLKFEPPHSLLLNSTGGATRGMGSRTASKTSLGRSGGLPNGSSSGSLTTSPTKTLTTAAVNPEERRALDAILPPQKWQDNGGLSYSQKVSSQPATASDVITLQDNLDRELKQRQARETALCPIRGELYAQTFDELIRQITVNSLERGLLTLRVRNEIRMTIAAYQIIYESSLAYGMRRSLQTEVLKKKLGRDIVALTTTIGDIKDEIANTVARGEAIQKAAAEARADAQARHEEEVAELVQVRDTLTRDLEELLTKKN